MNKKDFIAALRRRLSGLPVDELAERLEFYSEMIDDRVEEGLTEAEAVREIGTLDEVADRIREELGADELLPEHEPERRGLGRGQLVLLILSSPLWIAFLAPALVVMLAAYIVLWALVAALWAVELPFFILSMISKFLLIACLAATKGAVSVTKGGILGVKKSFKERKHSDAYFD